MITTLKATQTAIWTSIYPSTCQKWTLHKRTRWTGTGGISGWVPTIFIHSWRTISRRRRVSGWRRRRSTRRRCFRGANPGGSAGKVRGCLELFLGGGCRAHREKRLANRVISPPSYAARTSPTYPSFRKSKSPSKSPSPENAGKITYITSFGDEEESPSTSKSNEKKSKSRRRNESSERVVYISKRRSYSKEKSHRRRKSRSRSKTRRRSYSRDRYWENLFDFSVFLM